MTLDLTTLELIFGILNFMGLVVMIILWRINPMVEGLLQWMWTSFFWFVGFSCVYFFDGSFSTFINNACTLLGSLLLMEGILRFRGFGNFKKRKKFLILIAIISVIMSFINQTNPTMRYLYHDMIIILTSLIIIVAMLYKTKKTQFWVHLYLAVLYAITVPPFSYRWYLAFSGQLENQIIGSTDHAFQVYLFLSNIPLHIGWSFGVGLAIFYQMKQELKSVMELKWLQAQIQPHFIFNTLNSIMSLSLSDIEKMRELLERFSDFLRSKFDSHSFHSIVSFNEEIAIAESYLYIEKVRFGNKLNIEWEVDDVDGFNMPTLTIQPLVENAIKHGIMRQPGGGTIEVKAFKKNNYLRVVIKDSGVGIDKETVHLLKKEKSIHSSGVGLENTNRRLVEQFGKGLQIRSVKNVGTVIAFNVLEEVND
ncbi:sensor histidine kinase [Paraliobacillus salinarum]|uniref:sensor histidine kinase n=1 Tax=Paraliobacillus salinarum TaxID=1158996 RepID=UPI0015F3F993|nr:histidine kinase [Paraliobacillus salinarum]